MFFWVNLDHTPEHSTQYCWDFCRSISNDARYGFEHSEDHVACLRYCCHLPIWCDLAGKTWCVWEPIPKQFSALKNVFSMRITTYINFTSKLKAGLCLKKKTYSNLVFLWEDSQLVARWNSRHPRTSMGTERFASGLEAPRVPQESWHWNRSWWLNWGNQSGIVRSCPGNDGWSTWN